MLAKRYIIKFFIPFFLVAFFFSGCFGGVKNRGKVKGYRAGQVIMKKGFYEVGDLPSSWQRTKLDKAVINFRNEALQSNLATEAFCDRAYNDSNLKSLTQHLFGGMQETDIVLEEPIMLDGRTALYTHLTGKMDGVPVKVGIVVIKKDWCLFDFFLVSSPEHYDQAYQDFLNFYQGFQFSGELK